TRRQRVASRVVDIIEALAAALGLVVVPVHAPEESAGAAVTQLPVVAAPENRRDRVGAPESQAAAIRGAGGGLAVHRPAIDLSVRVDEAPVRIGGGPARPQ